ncbi:hypothetical protein [Cellulomonas sp. URHB0016]
MTDRPVLNLREFNDLNVFLRDAAADPRPYMEATISASMLAAVICFLSPPFIEYRGAVLLEFAFDQAVVDDWFTRLGDVADVERISNHVHVWDLLPSAGFSEAEAQRLAEPMAWFWRSALRYEYPDREFIVQAVEDGSYGPELTFFQG